MLVSCKSVWAGLKTNLLIYKLKAPYFLKKVGSYQTLSLSEMLKLSEGNIAVSGGSFNGGQE